MGRIKSWCDIPSGTTQGSICPKLYCLAFEIKSRALNQVSASIFEIKSQTLTHNENMPLKHNPLQATSLNIHEIKSRFHVHCTLINVRMITNMLKP
jgi:hypothetical protein